MLKELKLSNFSDIDLDEIENRLNKAFELAGTYEEFNKFREIQLEYQKQNFGKLTDPREAPYWEGSFFAWSPEEWKMAIALMIDAGFPQKDAQKIYKEEMEHFKKAVEQNMEAEFIIRFCYNEDKSITYEPAVISHEYNIDEKYGNKIKKVSDIPESSSDWDRKMIDLSEEYNKNPKP